ncbi:hypothetical protein [Helicobacter cetorum]|uniref:hypothetical protein n=1 Tax=Helicobacter cetorum TaxID=138563 RepID=UPI000CF025ED|nr:hypothetical protein [Helicobacter cetorum]
MKPFINQILDEREEKYGDYETMAMLDTELKEALRTHPNFIALPNEIKCSLEMILHKVARVVNGDYMHKDNFIDIKGYSELALRSIARYEEELKNDEEDFLAEYTLNEMDALEEDDEEE